MQQLYQALARTFVARENCRKHNNDEWFQRHGETIQRLVGKYMPSGNGFDCGTTYDLDEWKANKLVFHISFHHMNASGYYDGWTEHSIVITPDLCSHFEVRITGQDRNDIKEYIAQCFECVLNTEISDSQGE